MEVNQEVSAKMKQSKPRGVNLHKLEVQAFLAGNFDVACEQYAFELMWEVIHGRDSWQQNPWVWVIESLDHK